MQAQGAELKGVVVASAPERGIDNVLLEKQLNSREWLRKVSQWFGVSYCGYVTYFVIRENAEPVEKQSSHKAGEGVPKGVPVTYREFGSKGSGTFNLPKRKVLVVIDSRETPCKVIGIC